MHAECTPETYINLAWTPQFSAKLLNQNCYRLSHVSWTLAQISCFNLVDVSWLIFFTVFSNSVKRPFNIFLIHLENVSRAEWHNIISTVVFGGTFKLHTAKFLQKASKYLFHHRLKWHKHICTLFVNKFYKNVEKSCGKVWKNASCRKMFSIFL